MRTPAVHRNTEQQNPCRPPRANKATACRYRVTSHRNRVLQHGGAIALRADGSERVYSGSNCVMVMTS
jgi:hypothetical protein